MFLLDFPYRRDDLVIAQCLHGKVETHLVVAHAGATVRDNAGAEFISAAQRGFNDEIAVGNQQRILALVTLARPDKGFHEPRPDGGAAIDCHMAGHAQFRGTRFDEGTLLGVHAAGIGKNRMHGPAAFLQVRHAEAGVEAAGEGEDDVFGGHFIFR